MKCQTHFLQVVAVNEVYRELYKKQVIHQSVLSKITDSRSVQEARGHLFDHMREYGTLDTLNTFCDVITAEEYDGFQAMQDFGKLIKDMLEQEGWICAETVRVTFVCCICVCVPVCVQVFACLLDIPLSSLQSIACCTCFT